MEFIAASTDLWWHSELDQRITRRYSKPHRLKHSTVNYESHSTPPSSDRDNTRSHFSSFASSLVPVSSAQDWKWFLFRLWENVLLTRYIDIASLQCFIRLSFVSRFFGDNGNRLACLGAFFVYCLSLVFLSANFGDDCLLCLRSTMIMFSEENPSRFHNLISSRSRNLFLNM